MSPRITESQNLTLIMTKRKIIYILLFLFCLFVAAAHGMENNNQEVPSLFSAGLTAGWGAPYGTGVEFNYLILNRVDINAGMGINLSGLKIGVGSRLFFTVKRKFNPFIGINYSINSGFDDLEISSSDEESAHYRIPSNRVIHAKFGIKFNMHKQFALLGSAGYGFSLDDNKVTYLEGSRRKSLKNMANIAKAGGIEVSLTMMTTWDFLF